MNLSGSLDTVSACWQRISTAHIAIIQLIFITASLASHKGTMQMYVVRNKILLHVRDGGQDALQKVDRDVGRRK